MSRIGVLVGVAALVCATLNGCTLLDVSSLNVFAAVNEDKWEFSGSLESVVASAQDEMVKLNVKVDQTKEGDAIRLASAAPSGKKFDLVLTRVQGPNGEKTRVRIQWKGEHDDTFWFQLVENVATAKLPRNARQAD